VKESRLAGIVSIGDVMKWRLDEPKHEGHALTLEEAMAEAARRVAPHSPNSQYRPARAAPLISDHPIASRSFSPWRLISPQTVNEVPVAVGAFSLQGML
jgi:hypothetical protein